MNFGGKILKTVKVIEKILGQNDILPVIRAGLYTDMQFHNQICGKKIFAIFLQIFHPFYLYVHFFVIRHFIIFAIHL